MWNYKEKTYFLHYDRKKEFLRIGLQHDSYSKYDNMIMKLKKLNFDFTICKVKAIADIDLSRDIFFIGKTDDEISLVCRTEDTPLCATKSEDGWRGFRIQGTLDFSLTGVLSKLSGILAERKIGIFAISTYYTDYVLVKAENYDKAVEALETAGYEFG